MVRALGTIYSESGTWHSLAFAGWSACRCNERVDWCWNSCGFPDVSTTWLQSPDLFHDNRWLIWQWDKHIISITSFRFFICRAIDISMSNAVLLFHAVLRSLLFWVFMEFCCWINPWQKKTVRFCRYLLSCCTKGNASAILSAGVSLHIAAISFHVAAGLIGEDIFRSISPNFVITRLEDVPLRKLNMTMEKTTIWRGISYYKWWFSIAMVSFWGSRPNKKQGCFNIGPIHSIHSMFSRFSNRLMKSFCKTRGFFAFFVQVTSLLRSPVLMNGFGEQWPLRSTLAIKSTVVWGQLLMSRST